MPSNYRYCIFRYFLCRTCPLHTTNQNRGECGKREAHNKMIMVKPEKAAPVTGTTLTATGPVP